jgi:hypothetical protein
VVAKILKNVFMVLLAMVISIVEKMDRVTLNLDASVNVNPLVLFVPIIKTVT